MKPDAPESAATETADPDATRSDSASPGRPSLRRLGSLQQRLRRLRTASGYVPKVAAAGVGALLAVGVVAGGAIAIGSHRFDRSIDADVARLRTTTTRRGRPARFDPAVIRELPAPVRRYVETVLDPGQPVVEHVELSQEGEFRLGDADSDWLPMTATQQFTVSPPGFVWDATIEVAPHVPVRVVDRYVHGRGALDARLLSTIPVASTDPSPALNKAELLRYLGEAVWFPTALLPENGITWTAIDDATARATIHDHATSASLVFHFDDDGLVERVTTPARYRQDEDDYAHWTGYYDAYEMHNGILVPTHASAEWNLADGDLEYWRADVTQISYETR